MTRIGEMRLALLMAALALPLCARAGAPPVTPAAATRGFRTTPSVPVRRWSSPVTHPLTVPHPVAGIGHGTAAVGGAGNLHPGARGGLRDGTATLDGTALRRRLPR